MDAGPADRVRDAPEGRSSRSGCTCCVYGLGLGGGAACRPKVAVRMRLRKDPTEPSSDGTSPGAFSLAQALDVVRFGGRLKDALPRSIVST